MPASRKGRWTGAAPLTPWSGLGGHAWSASFLFGVNWNAMALNTRSEGMTTSRKPRSPMVETVKILIGGIAGLALGAFLIRQFMGIDLIGGKQSVKTVASALDEGKPTRQKKNLLLAQMLRRVLMQADVAQQAKSRPQMAK